MSNTSTTTVEKNITIIRGRNYTSSITTPSKISFTQVTKTPEITFTLTQITLPTPDHSGEEEPTPEEDPIQH